MTLFMNDSVVAEVPARLLLSDALDVSKASYLQKIEKCLFSSMAVFVHVSISADKAITARAVDLLSYWTASELHFPLVTSAILHSMISHLIKASLPLSLTVESSTDGRRLLDAILPIPISMWDYNRCTEALPDCLIPTLNDCSISCTCLLFLTLLVP